MPGFLEVEDIVVKYGNFTAVKGVSFAVPEGKMLCLLGPSGCGKTTILRTVAGFVEPARGKVVVAGRDYTSLPVYKRGMGLVFQNYALFPHLTVFENVAYGLRMRRQSRSQIEKTVMEMLEIVDLPHLADRYPAALSGGQQQRVALARALAIRPQVLLLDEPLSNLDAILRLRMRDEIRRLQQQFGVTSIFVTHDQAECFAVADQVIVLREGVKMQEGTPETIFNSPRNRFVASFVGFENILEHDGREWAIRAEDVQMGSQGSQEGHERQGSQEGLTLAGKVDLVSRDGRQAIVIVKTERGEIRLTTREEVRCTRGDTVSVFLPRKFLVPLEPQEAA